MTDSDVKRLTLGAATSVVLYIIAFVMAVMTLGLVIAAGNDAVIVGGGVHFLLCVFLLFSAVGVSTLAAAAADNLFSWPKGSSADPAPYQRFPNIDWKRADEAMRFTHCLVSLVYFVIAVALTMAATRLHPFILFSGVFHFGVILASLTISAIYLMAAGKLQDRNWGGDNYCTSLWIISIVLAFICVGIAMAAGKGAILLNNTVVQFVMVYGSLTLSAYTLPCRSCVRQATQK